jgi:hypothetical protein
MEATGVYWIPLYEVLERRGFKVLLVNARQTKNVSGRKSDVLDCQWLQQLLTFGLLRGAFRPADHMCALRALCRQRARLLRDQGRYVQHMHKAMTLMNLQLANTISDVAGVTGQKIVRAIVAGERDPQVLELALERAAARLCDRYTGVGADGILLVRTGEQPSMRVLNADGSYSEMCGNGIRCVVGAVAERRVSRRGHVLLQTGAGARSVEAVYLPE